MDTLAEAASSFIDFSSTTVGAPNRRGDMGGRRWGKGVRARLKTWFYDKKTHIEMGRERDRRSITDTTHPASRGIPSYIPQQLPHLITLDYPPYVH